MIKSVILRWEIIPDYPSRPNIITKALITEKGRKESQRRRRDKEVRGQDDESHE